jgi:xanthine dehydrogenase YagR molybdenum-binding subunit
MTTTYVGLPISRVDGRAKVTGEAKYAAEHNVANLAYGYVVSSAVAKGAVIRIDASDARRLPGVLQVLTHENVPRLPGTDHGIRDEAGAPGVPFIPLQDNQVRFAFNRSPSWWPTASSWHDMRHRSFGSNMTATPTSPI